jgi:hypothetical protein
VTVPQVFLVGIVSLLIAESAHADCAGSRLHDRFTSASVVFLADVLDVAVKGDTISFDVREAFKNSRPGPVTLTFVDQLSSESYHFRPGDRVLMYAWRRDGGALSTLCSGSQRADENHPDLPILRHLARGDAGGTVERVLSRFDYNWLRYPGLRITLRPRSGSGPVIRTMTGTAATGRRGGGFRFDWVPPGDYVVVLEAQKGVKRQERAISVGVLQKLLEVPPFIISAREHPLIADPDD